MTNEEKARQIAIEYEDLCVIDLEDVALKAMQWKDEQHEQEKQQLIDKACECLKQQAVGFWIDNLVYELKKAMKGGK